MTLIGESDEIEIPPVSEPRIHALRHRSQAYANS